MGTRDSFCKRLISPKHEHDEDLQTNIVYKVESNWVFFRITNSDVTNYIPSYITQKNNQCTCLQHSWCVKGQPSSPREAHWNGVKRGVGLATFGEELCGEIVEVLVDLLQCPHLLLKLRYTDFSILSIPKHTLVCDGTHQSVELAGLL